MWHCHCKNPLKSKNGSHTGHYRIKPHLTETTDEICNYCGHYAIWIKGGIDSKKALTVIHKPSLTFKVYSSAKEASQVTGVDHTWIVNSRPFKIGKLYNCLSSDYAFIKGHLNYINREIINSLENDRTKIYIYKKSGECVGEISQASQAKVITNDSSVVVLSNLRRETLFTMNGYLYSYSKNTKVDKLVELNNVKTDWID